VNASSSGEPGCADPRRGWNSLTTAAAPGSPARTARWNPFAPLRSCSRLALPGRPRGGTKASFHQGPESAITGRKGDTDHNHSHQRSRWASPFPRTGNALARPPIITPRATKDRPARPRFSRCRAPPRRYTASAPSASVTDPPSAGWHRRETRATTNAGRAAQRSKKPEIRHKRNAAAEGSALRSAWVGASQVEGRTRPSRPVRRARSGRPASRSSVPVSRNSGRLKVLTESPEAVALIEKQQPGPLADSRRESRAGMTGFMRYRPTSGKPRYASPMSCWQRTDRSEKLLAIVGFTKTTGRMS
jgi:hypothetical protein